ncbi:DUF2180 family protein [Streptomyces sp. GC420]|uniref:DUF2180 family protein n=1 Tax=Streptomyces sp. GC420 TaxID=2697568 RepID=UPI0014152B57|nr:DUF2180 family protein [Streptomyces sp. GC420]NBM17880.1 DUF2180 family protein [Streptomyces sp. GC420]
MNCYDCAQLGRTTPATAVCRHCGAAVCTAHARATGVTVHRTTGMGSSTRPRPARRITCTTCYDAEHSGGVGAPVPHRTGFDLIGGGR